MFRTFARINGCSTRGTAVEGHFNNRGVSLVRGAAEDTLAIVPETNRGIMFEFSE